MNSTKFLIKFFGIFFVILVLIDLINFYFFSNMLTYLIANYMGLSYINNIIFAGKQSFILSRYCLGLMSIGMLAAIIYTLDKPDLFKKTKIFLFGALLLIIVNVFRIIFVLFSATQGLDANLIHMLTWGIMSGIVILSWYYITKWVNGKIEF